jgi:hypothetical protein
MKIDNISRYVWLGRKDKTWYSDCKETLIDLFGEDELSLVTNLLAGTSINTSLKGNITLFRRAYYEIKNELPTSNYLPNIQQQINQIREGKELTGRKINSFAKAMRGDVNAIVVDIWILRAFELDRKYRRNSGPHEGTFRSGGATDKQYSLIESWIRQEAIYRSLLPYELCSMIWGGVRREQSGDNETRYCDILRQLLTNLFQVI